MGSRSLERPVATEAFATEVLMVSFSSPFTTAESRVCTQAWSVHCRAQGAMAPGWPPWASVPMKTSFMIVEKDISPKPRGNCSCHNCQQGFLCYVDGPGGQYEWGHAEHLGMGLELRTVRQLPAALGQIAVGWLC